MEGWSIVRAQLQCLATRSVNRFCRRTTVSPYGNFRRRRRRRRRGEFTSRGAIVPQALAFKRCNERDLSPNSHAARFRTVSDDDYRTP